MDRCAKTGKQILGRQESRRRVARMRRQGSGPGLHHYRCKACSGWHVGNVPNFVRKRRAR